MTAIITILTFLFVIGLVIGSFLNVVILRTVSGESIVFPGSHCPKCNTPLKWYHNIPVLSYIFLGGRCAFCHEVISFQYPLVELLTGLVFLWFGYLYIDPILNASSGNLIYLLMLIFTLIVSCLFIIISGTDIIELKVSDIHTYSLIGIGYLYSIMLGAIAFYQEFQFGETKWLLLAAPILCTVLSSLCAFIFMEILRRGANHLLKTETFGEGDSYIFAGVISALTALFGGYNIIYLVSIILCAFFISVILSVIFALPSYIKNIITKKNWYLLCLLTAFIIYAFGYFYAGAQNWLSGTAQLIICTIILVILGIALCYEILKGIKDKPEQTKTIPFGPALTVSGFIIMVFMPIILGFV